MIPKLRSKCNAGYINHKMTANLRYFLASCAHPGSSGNCETFRNMSAKHMHEAMKKGFPWPWLLDRSVADRRPKRIIEDVMTTMDASS
mmetsp:Transcript_9477/g.22659  ORF Transcript_9477/g.22659 Transcript_9477/m.22659 type:complete len:88 (+) Transcript_9477:720-983(+)